MRKVIVKGLVHGVAFSVGMVATLLFAVTVSTINTFQTGELLSSAKINENFSNLRTALESTVEPPVGSIIAWHKDMTGVPALPDGWVECNGQTINDTASPLDGEVAPNLNGDGTGANSPGLPGAYQMFLRGSTSSGTGQQDAFQGHGHRMETLVEGPGPNNRGFDWQGMTWMTFDDRIRQPITLSGYGGPRYATETRPVNMTVVWILRIR